MWGTLRFDAQCAALGESASTRMCRMARLTTRETPFTWLSLPPGIAAAGWRAALVLAAMWVALAAAAPDASAAGASHQPQHHWWWGGIHRCEWGAARPRGVGSRGLGGEAACGAVCRRPRPPYAPRIDTHPHPSTCCAVCHADAAFNAFMRASSASSIGEIKAIVKHLGCASERGACARAGGDAAYWSVPRGWPDAPRQASLSTALPAPAPCTRPPPRPQTSSGWRRATGRWWCLTTPP